MATLASTILARIVTNWPTGYHSTDLTAAVRLRHLNEVQRQLCRAHNFAFMKQEVTRSTADETQKYSVPTAEASGTTWTEVIAGSTILRFKRDISLELINSQSYRIPLIKLHKQLLEDKKILAKETGKGIPAYYDVDQQRIWLYKLPDHSFNADTAWTMNLEFFGYLADLATGGSNELTDNHNLLLEYAATARGYIFGKDWEEANRWKTMGQEIFVQMVEEDIDLQLSGQEEGFFPDPAQAIGGGDPYKGFLQGTDWYTS